LLTLKSRRLGNQHTIQSDMLRSDM